MQREAPGRPWQVRQTTLEIDLGLLKKNYRRLRERSQGAELLVLLKSDAYGHSHKEVARALEALGEKESLRGFGVANVEEGIELRREGIRRPVYVLSGIQHYDEDLHRCLDTCDLTPVFSSLRVLRQASAVVKRLCATRVAHLKLNTGMNRLGIDPKELEECLKILRATPGIQVEGLMSHLAVAEKPSSAATRAQVSCFRRLIEAFRAAGISPRYLHLSNSAGIAGRVFPEGNLVRAGLHLYGAGDPEMQAAARWTAQIYQLRELSKGDAVGYGGRFRAPKKLRMAVLGVGYGDGYRRALSNRAEVLLRGKRCPVIGAISMDLTAIDVSRVPEASTDDRVVLLGRDGRDEITAEELAGHAGTISWEILTGISPRVPRVFL